jgi:hypothetical protein
MLEKGSVSAVDKANEEHLNSSHIFLTQSAV